MNSLKFGERVRACCYLKRVCEYRQRRMYSGLEKKQPYKLWKEVPITDREGLFLGFRTLSNGFIFWESEVGYIFESDKSFRVALVIFSERENPIYVPLQSIIPM